MKSYKGVNSEIFKNIVSDIPNIGLEHHRNRLIHLAKENSHQSIPSITSIPPLDSKQMAAAIVVNAGPSIRKKNTLSRIRRSNYSGAILAVDGSYIACLKEEIIPDFVFVLDPHPTRRVRWFGDPNFESDMEGDDYFLRQDLDIEFRENSVEQNNHHIELVNRYADRTKAIVASTSSQDLVDRIRKAGFDIYWWNPLVDNPEEPNSITRELFEINQLPCVNTGGTVGSAAWTFADSVFDIPMIGLTGTDFGYYNDTPYHETQTYYELISYLGGTKKLDECFPNYVFPLTKEIFYTDPTYFWYRENFLELLKISKNKTFNCSEGGTLFGEHLECVYLEHFISLL